ncbi:MAG: L-histidine N(alpha)-methyltransferase [Rhodospirillales bacterium]
MNQDTALASYDDFAPESGDFLTEVIDGLSGDPKTLPCKYFYDECGSDLFQKICKLPEYYPTRTETRLLSDCAPDIAASIGAHCCLIEYGTGSSEKMRIVLNALEQPAAFIAVDISREHLLQATEALADDLSGLDVHAVCADFTKPFELPAIKAAENGKAVVFFPGSSIGNFDQEGAVDFLANAASLVGSGGGLVIGVDLKKDTAVLNAAYDDAAGVTAAFNLNLLTRINRELNGTFDVSSFSHRAFYNEDLGRIEMHLVSSRVQTAKVGGKPFKFIAGETIHTENSYKYTVDEFQEIGRKAGFRPVQAWTDRDNLFSVHYFETAA